MTPKNGILLVCVAIVFGTGFVLGRTTRTTKALHAQSADRVFELRTYTTNEGKLDDLHARFRDHTRRIFEKHGMTNVGYWTPQDEPRSENTLVYLLAHASREAAATSWEAFRDDPEWQRVFRESRADGPIVNNVESVFLAPTDYSAIR